MKNLTEKLTNNTNALSILTKRYEKTKSSEYYTRFGTESERTRELLHIVEFQKRVLKMRLELLAQIRLKAETESNKINEML